MHVKFFLGLKEQKSQLYKIHTTFRSQDRGQNNKRSLTFCAGVKFSSLSNFNENGLKLIRLSCRLRKCIVSYTLNVPILLKGESKFNGHRPYKGIDLWPLDSYTPWLPRYAKLYLLWIILVIQSIWAHFRWNRTNLKIWPPVIKVNDLLLIWPLSQEQNIFWITWNWIFCFLWPKEEFDMHYNLIEACWLFWYHVALPPPLLWPCAPDWFMCPP